MRAVSSALVAVAGSILEVAGTTPANMPEGGRVVVGVTAYVLNITGFVAWVVSSLRDKDRT
jgi:hypothetical protein